MSARLKKHAHTLHYLCHCKDKNTANAIIKVAPNELINCFAEISKNVLKGNPKLSPSHTRKLQRYKAYIREVAKKSNSHKVKRRILQKGGFIGALLKPLIGVIGPLMSGLLGKQ